LDKFLILRDSVFSSYEDNRSSYLIWLFCRLNEKPYVEPRVGAP